MKLTELPCGSLITTFILAVIFYIDSTVKPEEEDGIPGYFSRIRRVEIPTILHCICFNTCFEFGRLVHSSSVSNSNLYMHKLRLSCFSFLNNKREICPSF